MKANDPTASPGVETPVTFLDLLTIILSESKRDDLFDQKNIGTLRLLNKAIKDYIDKILPITTLKVFPEHVFDLPLKFSLTEKIKSLTVFAPEESGKKRCIGKGYEPALIKCHLPKLEKLTLKCNHHLRFKHFIQPCLGYWPALKCLELHIYDKHTNILKDLSETSLTSLKELIYTDFRKDDHPWMHWPSTIYEILLGWKGLTKLELETDLAGDEINRLFSKNSRQNLVEVKIKFGDIVKKIQENPPTYHSDTSDSDCDGKVIKSVVARNRSNKSGPCWPKLRKFDFKMHLYHMPINEFVLRTLTNAPCLEDLTLRSFLRGGLKFNFQDLHLPRLKKLSLFTVLTTEIYEGLFATPMPALETLEIESFLIRDGRLPSPGPPHAVDLSTFLVDHSTCPFPALRRLNMPGANRITPAVIRIVEVLLPSLRELSLCDIRSEPLETLFELPRMHVSSSSSPCDENVADKISGLSSSSTLLSRFEYNGGITPGLVEFFKLLPAHFPLLEDLVVGSTYADVSESGALEIEKLLRDAAKEGVWYNLKSVELQLWTRGKPGGVPARRVRVWPY